MEIDFQNPSLLDKENEELLITDERNVEEEINYELCLVGTFLGERMVQVRQLPSSFDAEALAKILLILYGNFWSTILEIGHEWLEEIKLEIKEHSRMGKNP
ncbi:hypothetical protein Gotri_024302 [Gossypium trilobum]|uniref:Uncharacterized protein n=1 Tax=Gossypium trilobum TaxID=34281 RepID=A0A7J9DLU3_9ROSI|nr:hypothetical protein [Gossypium trilobum]